MITFTPDKNGTLWFDELAHLLHVKTGERKIVEGRGIWNEESNSFEDYIWSEGNFSCDCNRLSFMFGGDHACGDGAVRVEKIVAKEEPETILYSETEPKKKEKIPEILLPIRWVTADEMRKIYGEKK